MEYDGNKFRSIVNSLIKPAFTMKVNNKNLPSFPIKALFSAGKHPPRIKDRLPNLLFFYFQLHFKFHNQKKQPPCFIQSNDHTPHFHTLHSF